MNSLVGHTIKGYDIQALIGKGAFGVVYRAHQSIVNREVAIKIILPQYANQPDFVRRFETEAQLVAHLEHIHIVPLYDYWRDPSGAYLVLRYLRGGSLRDWLKEGPLSPEETLRVMEQVARALEQAHRRAIIHRDIKPTNILLDDDRNAFLADFGLAKVMGYESSQEGPLGTPEYTSPEQIQGREVSPQSDIYSLGLVLYEMLAGQPAFRPSNMAEMVDLHLKTPVPDITDQRDDVPDTINDVIQIATAKSPTDRYPDALALARALREALAAAPAVRIEAAAPLVEPLTDRELDVLRLMAEGLSYRDIAAQLVLAKSTVAGYRSQIFGKLGVSKRQQAIVVAQRLGLLAGTQVMRKDIPIPDELIGANPYKGLRAFQQADAVDFFGRDTLVEHLVACLHEDGELYRFLAVVGPSGCGKSSVIKAGLLPALKRGAVPGSENWFVVDMLPGASPLGKLEVALMRVAIKPQLGLMDQLARDAHGLIHAAELVLPDDRELLMVIDQFEELFTLVENPAITRHFLSLIHAAVTDPRSNVHVIITLRADFFDRPLIFPDFGELLRWRTEVVVPMMPAELEAAIVKPAENAGVVVESSLVSTLVAEVSEQPGTLPLLEYALTELFDRKEGRTMTLDAYHDLGGALGALARRADDRFDELSEAERDTARQMFLRLVTLGEGTEDVRRRVLRSELEALDVDRAVMEDVLDAFDEDRLLTFDFDPTTREPTVEVAHEALIQRWGRLREWLDASGDDMRLQRMLTTAANEWITAAHDSDFLLQGSRLAQFEGWADRTVIAFTGDERAFLEASITNKEQQRARQRRVRNLIFAIAATIALIMSGLSLFLNKALTQVEEQRDISQTARREAQELALVNGAQVAFEKGDQDTALALAIVANRGSHPSVEAQAVLAEITYAPETLRVLKGHTLPVIGADFSPDGRFALSGAGDGIMILWDTDSESPMFGSALHHFEKVASAVYDVAFSPNGRTALSCGDNTAFLWDVDLTSPTFGTLLHRFEGHTNWVQRLEFSPDGRTALSVSNDTTMILWDVDLTSPTFGTLLHRFEGHAGGVFDVAISPDGRTALSGSMDTTMILWDIDQTSPSFGEMLHRFEGHSDGVIGVAISSDGRTALSGSADSTVRLWDIETYQEIRQFDTPSQRAIVGVNFDPDGRNAVIVSTDAAIDLYDVETGELIRRLEGHTAQTQVAVFHPNGQVILSGSVDTTLRLWNLKHGAQMRSFANPLPALTRGAYPRVEISPDGRTILVGGEIGPGPVDEQDQAAVLIDTASGDVLRQFGGYPLGACCMDFAPDGNTALIGGFGGEMVLWDTNNGERLHIFPNIFGLWNMTFSPSGRMAISTSDGCQTLTLWDVDPKSPSLGNPVRHFVGSENDCFSNAIAFIPDGHWFLAGTRTGPIVVWDVETGRIIHRLDEHNTRVLSIDVNPDGKTALSGAGDGNLILWDLVEGRELRRFIGQPGAMYHLEFGPDGLTAFSDSFTDGVTQWDVATGQAIRRYPYAGIGGLLRPDGRSFFTVSDTAITEWRVDTHEELVDWAFTHRNVRELTCTERQKYSVEPVCDDAGIFPTSTPRHSVLVVDSSAVPPTAITIHLTATPVPRLVSQSPATAVVGENRGEVAWGNVQSWQYKGQAGEILTIHVSADHPANWVLRSPTERISDDQVLDTVITVVGPDNLVLTLDLNENPLPGTYDIEPGTNTDSLAEKLILPTDGTYLINVGGYQSGGTYTLTIVSTLSENLTSELPASAASISGPNPVISVGRVDPGFSPYPGSSESLKLYREGRYYLEHGEYELAVEKLTQAIEGLPDELFQVPDYADMYWFLGEAKEGAGMYAEALVNYQTFLDLVGELAAPWTFEKVQELENQLDGYRLVPK
jgi:WD40 repeat protein/DNA-binding CsgD family transcriptional regulator